MTKTHPKNRAARKPATKSAALPPPPNIPHVPAVGDAYRPGAIDRVYVYAKPNVPAVVSVVITDRTMRDEDAVGAAYLATEEMSRRLLVSLRT